MTFSSRPRRRPGRESSRPADGPDADPMEVAREIALRRLSLRPHSRQELAQQLAAKGVPDEVTSELLERYEEVGLVDDAAFASAWAESRQGSKLLSRSAVARELAGKGVDREVIDEATSQIDHETELSAATTLAERRFRSMRELPREVAYRRLAGMLARKGYGPGVITPVLRQVLDADLDEADDPFG